MEEEIEDAEILEGEIVTLSTKVKNLLQSPWPKESRDLIDTLQLTNELSEAEMYSILVAHGRKFGIVKEEEYEDIPSPRKEILPREHFDLIPYERTPVKSYNFMELIESEDLEVEWEMDGLIVEQSIFAIGGDSGIGKTQAMIRLGIALATSGEFLGYKTNKPPRRVVFFSLEMHAKSIKKMLRDMAGDLSKREKELIRENFIILPYGERLSLNEKEGKLEYWRAMQEFKPDGIMIDSWSQAISGDLISNEINRDAMAFVMLLRKHFECFIGIIHHAKKPQGDTKFTDQDALYGSIYFVTPLDMAVIMYKNRKDPKKIEFKLVKNRFEGLPDQPILIRRTKYLNFMVDSGSVDALSLLGSPKSSDKVKQLEADNTKKMNQTLGEMLGLGKDFEFQPAPPIPAEVPDEFDKKFLEEKHINTTGIEL